MKQNAVKKSGFTLIELLVVVLIIGVLSAVALPGYRKAMEKAKAAEAIQALSDISKSQHDYYLAKNRYTNDFSDLVLTMKDKNTLSDADHSSYATEHFVYNLDNNQDLATASRDKGADSYTLYRFYEDPITYCQPKGNKYCEMLGLPAGTFTHSIGAWQSCPGGVYPCSMNCSRNTTQGYSCYGTYNENGTFTEKVCDANGYCVTTQYNADQKGLRKSHCFTYNENGICTSGGETIYDENGNLLGYYKCTAWAQDGTCTAGTYGSVFTYDSNGNRTSYAQCTSWNSDGTCAVRDGGSVYTYDENGNNTSSSSCKSWNSDGTCAVREGGSVYTYDENGKITSKAYCTNWNSDGTCRTYYPGGLSLHI